MNEAGPLCRDQYFERLEAIKHFEQMELQQKVSICQRNLFQPCMTKYQSSIGSNSTNKRL